MAGIVQEPSYEVFNNYCEHTEYYGTTTQESFFIPRNFIGKTCFYNYTITNELIGTNNDSCINNCKVCYENYYCIKCSENYIINENLDTCLVNAPIDGYYYDEISDSYKECNYLCITCSKGPIFENSGLLLKIQIVIFVLLIFIKKKIQIIVQNVMKIVKHVMNIKKIQHILVAHHVMKVNNFMKGHLIV